MRSFGRVDRSALSRVPLYAASLILAAVVAVAALMVSGHPALGVKKLIDHDRVVAGAACAEVNYASLPAVVCLVQAATALLILASTGFFIRAWWQPASWLWPAFWSAAWMLFVFHVLWAFVGTFRGESETISKCPQLVQHPGWDSALLTIWGANVLWLWFQRPRSIRPGPLQTTLVASAFLASFMATREAKFITPPSRTLGILGLIIVLIAFLIYLMVRPTTESAHEFTAHPRVAIS